MVFIIKLVNWYWQHDAATRSTIYLEAKNAWTASSVRDPEVEGIYMSTHVWECSCTSELWVNPPRAREYSHDDKRLLLTRPMMSDERRQHFSHFSHRIDGCTGQDIHTSLPINNLSNACAWNARTFKPFHAKPLLISGTAVSTILKAQVIPITVSKRITAFLNEFSRIQHADLHILEHRAIFTAGQVYCCGEAREQGPCGRCSTSPYSFKSI